MYEKRNQGKMTINSSSFKKHYKKNLRDQWTADSQSNIPRTQLRKIKPDKLNNLYRKELSKSDLLKLKVMDHEESQKHIFTKPVNIQKQFDRPSEKELIKMTKDKLMDNPCIDSQATYHEKSQEDKLVNIKEFDTPSKEDLIKIKNDKRMNNSRTSSQARDHKKNQEDMITKKVNFQKEHESPLIKITKDKRMDGSRNNIQENLLEKKDADILTTLGTNKLKHKSRFMHRFFRSEFKDDKLIDNPCTSSQAMDIKKSQEDKLVNIQKEPSEKDVIKITNEKLMDKPCNSSQAMDHEKNQEDMISKLVNIQKEFDTPSAENFKITPFSVGKSEDDRRKRRQHATEIILLTVQLIVEFVKRIPYIDTLFREDLIALLKANIIQVLILKAARKHDMRMDCIILGNNRKYTITDFHSASMREFGDAIFKFCRKISSMKFGNAEYALLTAILIVSETPLLIEPKKVEKIRELYIKLLKFHIDRNRQADTQCFDRLPYILHELRTLSNMDSLRCFLVNFDCQNLPPFMKDILNELRKRENLRNNS